MKEKPYKINSSGICPTGSRARRYFGICPLWDKSQTPHGSKESCHLTLSPHSLRPTQKESHLTVAFSDCRKSRSTASKVKNIAGKGFTLFSASNKINHKNDGVLIEKTPSLLAFCEIVLCSSSQLAKSACQI